MATARAETARQPHIYGARPQHYRRGNAIGTGEEPPWWSPELEADQDFPYTIDEWEKDINRWAACTKAVPERHGPILSMCLGTAARTIADDISSAILAHGATVDLNDRTGLRPRSGPEILVAVLRSKFPPDPEAAMLRCGMEFFAFTPFVGERANNMFTPSPSPLANERNLLTLSFQTCGAARGGCSMLDCTSYAETSPGAGSGFLC